MQVSFSNEDSFSRLKYDTSFARTMTNWPPFVGAERSVKINSFWLINSILQYWVLFFIFYFFFANICGDCNFCGTFVLDLLTILHFKFKVARCKPIARTLLSWCPLYESSSWEHLWNECALSAISVLGDSIYSVATIQHNCHYTKLNRDAPILRVNTDTPNAWRYIDTENS